MRATHTGEEGVLGWRRRLPREDGGGHLLPQPVRRQLGRAGQDGGRAGGQDGGQDGGRAGGPVVGHDSQYLQQQVEVGALGLVVLGGDGLGGGGQVLLLRGTGTIQGGHPYLIVGIMDHASSQTCPIHHCIPALPETAPRHFVAFAALQTG